MEENENNIVEAIEKNKDEEIKEEEKKKEIINSKDNNENKKEENNQEDNMNDIVLNSKPEKEETLLNKNKDKDKDNNIPENAIEEKIILNNNVYVNEEYQNKNTMITDYIIKIQYSKFLHIPYFIFGNVLHLYCPCHKFKSERINLSKMPTPPFAISLNGCKTYSF